MIELNKVFFEVSAPHGDWVVFLLIFAWQLLRHFDIQLVDPSRPWKSFNVRIFIQSKMFVRITKAEFGA
jgi:hypothetical protein